jgi:hypothetical protein
MEQKMAKLQIPKDGGAISYDGVSYVPDKKGVITLPDDVDLSVFQAQGYVVISDATVGAAS